MYCNKYRTDEYSETLSIEALARACSFCSPPIPTPPLFLSNFQHVPTRSASKTAFNLGIFVSQCPIITTTGVLFDCPPFREPLHQDQLLRISQTVIAQNPSAHLHLLRIPVCMRKVSCDSRHWQVQDASRLGELLIQRFVHLMLRGYDSSASNEVTDAYRGILTSNWILGSYALRCGVRESMLSPPILPTDDLEERMARLANVPLAWIGMAHVCSSYDEDPIIEWTKLVILPLILDVVSFLKRATAVSHGIQSTSPLIMKPAYQSSRSLARPLNAPSTLREVFNGVEPPATDVRDKMQDRRIRLEVEERSPEYALFDEYMRAKWMTILASSYAVVTPSLPKKFSSSRTNYQLTSQCIARVTTWRPRRILASSSEDFFLRSGFIRCQGEVNALTPVKLHPRVEKRKRLEDCMEKEIPDVPREKRARLTTPMPRNALAHLEDSQAPLSVVQHKLDEINLQSQAQHKSRQTTPFQWPYPRSDAYQDIWGREMSIHANVGGMTAPALGSEYFNLRTPTSTSTKPRLNRSRKTGGPCLIRPHKGPCSRECPLTVGFTRLQNSHKRMAPRSLTVAVQIHLAFKVLRKNGSPLSFVPKLMIS